MSPQNDIQASCLEVLERNLPSCWELDAQRADGGGLDSAVLRSESGQENVLRLFATERVDPAFVRRVGLSRTRSVAPLILAPFIGASAQAMASDLGVNYCDASGNFCVKLSNPGVSMRGNGAVRTPRARTGPQVRSLKGSRAARVVRALYSCRRVPSVRRLGAMAEVSPSYVAGVLAYLRSEAVLIGAGPREEAVDWERLLRLWSRAIVRRPQGDKLLYFRDAASAEAFAKALQGVSASFAVSGSAAANTYRYYAPMNRVLMYTEDLSEVVSIVEQMPSAPKAVERLDQADIVIVNEADPQIIERAEMRDGLPCVTVGEALVDLLSGESDDADAGEALLQWMKENESEWRAQE